MGDKKAADYMAAAEKKKNSFSFFGGTTKFEDAAENYEKAGNLYKMEGAWKEAGAAFRECAACHVKTGSHHDTATALTAAAGCFKKIDQAEAIKCQQEAINEYCNLGRFQTAAKMFAGEDATSSANSCDLKVAQFSATAEKYADAIEIYEKVGFSSIDSNLLKWSVKDYFFRAGLCHLCVGDHVATEKALDKYTAADATFESTRECKLLRDILDAVKAGDVAAFTNVVAEFDSVSKLDSWKTTILLRIKNSMKEDLLDGGGGGGGAGIL